MKNKRTFKVVGGVAIIVALAFVFMGGEKTITKMNSTDEALLALIKSDQSAFESWIKAGGDLHALLPLIDGKTYTVAEGMVYFQRPSFIKFVKANKIPFVVQDLQKDHDIVSMAVTKNDPEILDLIISEKPILDRKYGREGWTLLHKASADCSDKAIDKIHQAGLNWNMKADDGTTPLTLAAARSCLGVLNYWKNNKADFTQKDATGKAPLDFLKTSKDPAIQSFTVTMYPAKKAAPEMIPNFYNKRKFPKDRLADKSYMLEPEDRPDEAYETADYSEFAD